MQLIHWFTNNKKFESEDTVAVLEAILVSAVVAGSKPQSSSFPPLSSSGSISCLTHSLTFRMEWSTPWTARCATSVAAASKSL